MKPVHRETLEQQVYETLRSQILGGRIAGATRLVQGDLAAQLGTSRIPVRDALRRLAVEGLVEIDERGIHSVTEFKVEDLREIYEIRRRLESMAVGHAVARLTASDLEALTELSREMEAAVARKEAERYVGLNYQFHMTLYEASRCKRLFKLINGLWSGIPPLAPMAVRGQLAQSFREHQALLDALKQRDRQAAEEAILAHISNAERSLLSSLQERGQQQNVLSLVQGEQP